MSAVEKKKIGDFLASASDENLSTTERGRALEDLAVYLFELIPGIEAKAKNHVASFGCEEIDVVLRNRADRDGLSQFDKLLLVECKNWSRKVGSLEVAWFDTKLRVRAREHGILIALAGITGDKHERTAAHDILQRSVGEGRRILVLTRDDLLSVDDSDGLVDLMEQRELELLLDLALPA